MISRESLSLIKLDKYTPYVYLEYIPGGKSVSLKVT